MPTPEEQDQAREEEFEKKLSVRVEDTEAKVSVFHSVINLLVLQVSAYTRPSIPPQ